MAEKDYYSFEEVLKNLKLEEDELKRLVSAGEIRAFRDKDTMRFKAEDVDRLRSTDTEDLVLDDDLELDLEEPVASAPPPAAEPVVEELDLGGEELVLEEPVAVAAPATVEELDLGSEPSAEAAPPARGKARAAAGAGARRAAARTAEPADEKAEGVGMLALLIVGFVILVCANIVVFDAIVGHGTSSLSTTIANMFLKFLTAGRPPSSLVSCGRVHPVLCSTMKSLAVGLVLAGAVLPGCVSSTKYRSLEDEHVKTKEELDATKGQLDDAQGMLVESEGQQNALKQKAQMAEQMKAENEKLQAKIDELMKKGTITAPDGTTLFTQDGQYGWRAQGDVVFAPGSAKLTKDGERIITAIAKELKKSSEPITVKGHTDTDPVNKTAADWPHGNIQLGAGRAITVTEYLVAQGIEEARISIQSFGPYSPIATGNSAEAKAKNRRVEIMTKLAGGPN